MKRNQIRHLTALILLAIIAPMSVTCGQMDLTDELFHGTFLGGSDLDRLWDITLDSHGNIIVCGGTFSADFPIVNAFQETFAGGSQNPDEYVNNMGEGFVAKFNPDYTLQWSTFIGGNGLDCAFYVNVDEFDNVIVVGQTTSIDFPFTFPSNPSGRTTGDPFIAMYTPEGELIGARLYHPEEINMIQHVELDSAGNLVMVGSTSSTAMYCTEDAFQTELRGETDGFVRVVSPDFENILFSTYIGGSDDEFLGEVAVGSDDSIYLSGSTSSDDLPVTEGAIRPVLSDGETDNFVVKICPSRNLVMCTYIGGSDVDHVFGLCEGPDDSIVFVGRTWSSDYPVTPDALQTEYSSTEVDGFLTQINDSGTEIIYSTYFGRESWDSLLQVNMDEDGKLVITGFVLSGGFDMVNAFQSDYKGASDIVLIVLGEEIDLISLLGGYSNDHPTAQVLEDGKILLVGSTGSSGFMVSENAYQTALGGGEDGFLWVFDYDAYLAGGYAPEPAGPDYTPYISLGLVLGVIAAWFLVMKKWFRAN